MKTKTHEHETATRDPLNRYAANPQTDEMGVVKGYIDPSPIAFALLALLAALAAVFATR